MELEGYSRRTCALYVSGHDALDLTGVTHKLDRRRVLLTTPIDLPWRNFLSLEFGANFQREVPLFFKLHEFPYITV